MLSSVSKDKKVVMRPMEKMYVLDKLRSGTRYSAVGCELKVNESTTLNEAPLNRNTHKHTY